MRKYRVHDDKCAVCDYSLTQQESETVTCPKCGTIYDLVNGKIDNTNTMVGTTDCRHRKVEFISGARWSDDTHYGSHTVTLCLDCGQFTVIGVENGQPYKVGFVLPTDELAIGAGKYARLLSAEESGIYHIGKGLMKS